MNELLPPYPLIRDALSKGRVIPFLGAGASMGERAQQPIGENPPVGELNRTRCPTAFELASYLARKTGFPADETPDLAKVAQYYDVVGGRDALDGELHSIFDCDYPLTSLHTFLAEVPAALLIVTTNYDDLIERAFDAKGRPYDLVIHTTDPEIGDRLLWREQGADKVSEVIPKNLDIDLDTVTVIYKMHGAVDRRDAERDQYVITEDDYIDFLTRMTRNRAVPHIFAEPFQTKHFLFLGYGLRDWNLRVVLNRIEKDMRGKKGVRSWAVQFNPSPLEQRFWQKRGVEVYNKTIDEFVSELASR